jgi:hypothetical protein
MKMNELPIGQIVHDLYVHQGLSDAAIGAIYGRSRKAVSLWRVKYGIPTRPIGSWLIGKAAPSTSAVGKQYRSSHSHPMLGRKHRPETKAQMAASWSGSAITPERNKKISETMRRKYGTRNQDKKYLKNLIRKSARYKGWRKAVFVRDNYTCCRCGARNGSGKTVYLEAHHIQSFETFPELRFEINNGEALCRPCHLKIR